MNLYDHRRPPRGGRGLKLQEQYPELEDTLSPPSRGAWIEIAVGTDALGMVGVAPLAGGVD